MIWALDETTTPFEKNVLCVLPKGSGPNSGSDYTGLSSFGTDANGEIYLCQMSSVGGRIYKLARGGPPPPAKPFPKLLSQTGAFGDLATLAPAAGLIPYTVNSPLWSDGAVKSRWLALPANTAIGFAPNGEWTFPAGTVFVKNFELPVDDTNPKVLRRLETRLLVRDTNGTVYGASYKWRADSSDADLVTAGTNEDILIKTATGTRVQRWFYPGRQDCLTCHTPASGGVLGVKTRQLNGNFKYPDGVTDNQLRAWNHIGLFDTNLDERQIPRFTRLVTVTDTSASLEWRVRSYLDANCSQCHRPGGAEAFFDARIDTPLGKQNLVNGPVGNPLGISGAKIIVPRDAGKSVLFHRISTAGNLQMPPLAKNVVDHNAVSVIAKWIDSLPSTMAVAAAELEASGHRQRRAGGRRRLFERPVQLDCVRHRHLGKRRRVSLRIRIAGRRRRNHRARCLDAIHRSVGQGGRDVPRIPCARLATRADGRHRRRRLGVPMASHGGQYQPQYRRSGKQRSVLGEIVTRGR